MSVFKKFLKFCGVTVNETEEEKIFDSSSAVSAQSAYMSTKYGRDKSLKTLLSDFFTHANALIKTKTMNGDYCCMLEIDDDLYPYIPRIIVRFKDELGYNIALIDNNTEIVQNGKSMGKLNPDSTFIILMWNKVVLKDDTHDCITSVVDTKC